MPDYNKPLWNKFFSHVYVERDALDYPLTERVLAALTDAIVIPVTHYKDVFCRTGQDYNAQKQSPKLILAVRHGQFLFPGAQVCDHYGHDHFFYTTQMMNCPFHCEYCYLKGMYASAYIVAFVNTEDYFKAVRTALPAYVSISYEADLLAMERLFHFVSVWIAFATAHPSLTVEIRTKSAGYEAIASLDPLPNVILSWTVSPETVAARYEHGASSLLQRLRAMRAAMDAGWNVRLCADPVLLLDGWENDWHQLWETARQALDFKKLYGISTGGFRISKTYYKRMRKLNPGSFIFALPLTEIDGVMRYRAEDEAVIKAWAEGGLL